MGSDGSYRVEVVRDQIDAPLSERLIGFWTDHGALDGGDARARLEAVVCVLLGPDGAIAGANSVSPAEVPLFENQRLWSYRSFLGPDVPLREHRPMMSAAKLALEERYTGAENEPIGLMIKIAAEDVIAALPEALWEESEIVHAGWEAGSQLRVGWFGRARI